MKTIAIVGMSNNPGGVETYILNFVSVLEKKYHFVLINTDPSNAIAYEDELKNLHAKIFLASGAFSLESYFQRKKKAKMILQSVDADIVYVNALTPNNAYWVRAAKQLKINAVYHSHNDSGLYSNPLKAVAAAIMKPFNQYTLSYAVKLAASLDSGQYMFGKKARFEVVYNSIYTSKWKFNPLERIKIRNKLNIKNDKKVIVSVARLDTQKNSIRLIKILATLFKFDNTFCAVLVGDGPLRSEIESKIAEAGMTDKIMLLGMQKNVAPLLWASDIFILPSLFEGLPFVIVEAQAAGLPSIVSDGVIPSVADVTDQVFSINLSASDTEWSDLIRQISLTSDSDRLEMNQLVRDSRFSIEAFTQQIIRIFASLKEEDGQNG